jgi:hypothetical protein
VWRGGASSRLRRRLAWLPEGRSGESQRPGAKPGVLDDRVSAEKILSEPIDGGQQPFRFVGTMRGINPHQHNARNRLRMAEDQVAEIFFPPVSERRAWCAANRITSRSLARGAISVT